MENKSIFGLNQNIAAALSYLLGPFTGIMVLILERDNKFVRFHALQSSIWSALLWGVGFVLCLVTGLPIIGWLLGVFVRPVLFFGRWFFIASKIYLMYKACKGDTFKLPIVGDVVWNQINK